MYLKKINNYYFYTLENLISKSKIPRIRQCLVEYLFLCLKNKRRQHIITK